MTNKQKALEIARTFTIGQLSSTPTLCCQKSALEMAEWKDEEFNEERKELLELVKMLPVNENNQTIIEDLIGILE